MSGEEQLEAVCIRNCRLSGSTDVRLMPAEERRGSKRLMMK
jgi:hypothetical protein